jgi:hypothetical protein
MKYKMIIASTILGVSAVAFAANVTPANQATKATLSTSSIQNTVNLYQDSTAESKVLSTLSYQELNQYKPIFTNKEGWTKVGSTTNGNIGWIKPLKERVEPLKTALLEVEKKQSQIVEQYRTEMFKAQNQESEIINQLNVMSQFNKQLPNQSTIFAAPLNSKYESTEVSYSSANKNGMAKVTQSWLGKDGKTHSKTFEVPVKDINSIATQG